MLNFVRLSIRFILEISEIIKKVRKLEIRSRKLSTNYFSGEYHSAFRGKGMLFKEVRDYYPGDDIRFIDWNVSARFGHPFSKVFEEERERTVMLIADYSESVNLGSFNRTKREMMIEIAAILGFSALSNGDKIGAIFFTDKVEKYIPPLKGRQHLLYMLRSMISFEPASMSTNTKAGLEFFQKTTRAKTILFLMGDLNDMDNHSIFKAIGHRHDAIAIQLHDPKEDALPKAGLIPIENAETGEVVWIDSNHDAGRQQWDDFQNRKRLHIKNFLKKAGWGYLLCSTPDDEAALIQKFFQKRSHH
jgi:uncharacterized protein (DUF58 family)